MDIEVGDLLQVHNGEEFPVDLLIIKSSKESGIAFLDTMNLGTPSTPKPHRRRDKPKRETSSKRDKKHGGIKSTRNKSKSSMR
jgi:magnesium-transporting ATPase (P-type)